MVLVKHFSLRLRKILLCDSFYIILLFLTIFYLLIYNLTFKIESIYNINETNFTVKIINYKIDGDKLNLTLNNNLIGTYYFKMESEKNDFINNYSLNDTIKIKGSLTIPNNNTIPNTFNYKKYLYHKNIKYILNIESFKKIETNKNILYKIKNYFYKRINNMKYNNYMFAFILGDSTRINNDSYNNYKINGVTHLFALSGLHVSMFSSILLFILKKLKFNEKLSFIFSSIFLLFFSFIASFSPSILRAVIFFMLSNINEIYYFYIKPKNLLYLTFIILILINPNYIFNTGFILSFTITFFILFVNENIKIDKYSLLKISLFSFLSSLPIIINLSYEINIIGFINNLIFIPFVSSIVFPLSLICLLFKRLSFILNIFTNIMETISLISTKILNLTIYFPKFNIFEIVVYYILLILIIKKYKKLIYVLFLFLLIIYIKPYFNKNTYVYYLDVSQGDSSLILTKNNKTILIDTGGIIDSKKEEWKKRNKEFNLMTSNIIPFFKSIGIKKIDYLILSHGDTDHMGYSIDLLNNFKVSEVIFNKGSFNNLESVLLEFIKSKNIKYDSNLNYLNVDNINLQFLNTDIYDNENDNSNVIYTEINNYKFLFMGDASSKREEDLINNYNLNNIDFLKVSHHGSNTSTNKYFTSIINPKYSIISVGKNNRYNHPSSEVLNNLVNSKIYRTDYNGTIEIKFNNKLNIKTYLP